VEKDDDGMSTTELVRGPLATATGGIDLQSAVEFIWWEADLLDRHDYKPWLAAWTADGRYVIPTERAEDENHAMRLNIAYDDAVMRVARVKRLLSGFAMSSAPSARTARTLSRFVRTKDTAEGLEIRCAQHIIEHKFERTRILAADILYRLVRTDGGIALAYKEVRLINSDEPLWGIGYLL
jgi:3-phenylpropionate/cinnamic acid dioxygenase small subunit